MVRVAELTVRHLVRGDIRINEIATSLNEGVQQLIGSLLVHRAEHTLPGLAQTHGTELQWRDADAGRLGEDSVPAQRSGRLGSGLEERHCGIF